LDVLTGNTQVNNCIVKEKGKEDYLYSAFIQCLVLKRLDMNHTVLPANYTTPAFSS